MAKPLKDILAGVKKSKVVPGSTGKDPGVDYAPKAKADQDFVAQHSTEKHEDRVGNGDDVYKGTTKYVLDSPKEAKHGHKKVKDSAVYDQVKEDTLNEKVDGKAYHDWVKEDGYWDKGVGSVERFGLQSNTHGHIIRKKDSDGKMKYHAHAYADSDKKVSDSSVHDDKASAKKWVVTNALKLIKKHYQVKESLVVPLVGSADGDESAEMAKTELRALANKAMHLVASVPDSMVIEPWVQSKIAKAKEMISSVHDYMVYGDHEEQTAPYDGGIDMSSGTVRNTLPNFSADVNTGRNV